MVRETLNLKAEWGPIIAKGCSHKSRCHLRSQTLQSYPEDVLHMEPHFGSYDSASGLCQAGVTQTCEHRQQGKEPIFWMKSSAWPADCKSYLCVLGISWLRGISYTGPPRSVTLFHSPFSNWPSLSLTVRPAWPCSIQKAESERF